MVARFEEDPLFDWREVAVDFPEAQAEIAGNENFDDELAKEERESSRLLEAQFTEVFRTVLRATLSVSGSARSEKRES